MNARVVFSKKTQEKINKELTPKEKGRLRWGKLKEAEESGKLAQAKTRKDVIDIAGYTDFRKGYSWLANLIRRGYIEEILCGVGECAYYIKKDPDYSYNKSFGHNKRKKAVESVEQNVEVVCAEPEERTKLTIKTQGAIVEIESASVEIVEKVLDKVCVNMKI